MSSARCVIVGAEPSSGSIVDRPLPIYASSAHRGRRPRLETLRRRRIWAGRARVVATLGATVALTAALAERALTWIA